MGICRLSRGCSGSAFNQESALSLIDFLFLASDFRLPCWNTFWTRWHSDHDSFDDHKNAHQNCTLRPLWISKKKSMSYLIFVCFLSPGLDSSNQFLKVKETKEMPWREVLKYNWCRMPQDQEIWDGHFMKILFQGKQKHSVKRHLFPRFCKYQHFA